MLSAGSIPRWYASATRYNRPTERWPSGLRRTLGKRVDVNSVPWVRIPLSPPHPSLSRCSEKMAGRPYRLTAAGRDAWEGQDAAVPADYRRILWMMDVQGQGGVAEALSKLYPAGMLEEWLSEMEEIGLIESLPEGEPPADGFASRASDSTLALDQAQLR